MASSGNPNQVGGGFDMQKLFKANNSQNPNPSSSSPLGYGTPPSALQFPSYSSPQPPNVSNLQPGPFSYSPRTSPYHPYMQYPPDPFQNSNHPLRPPFSTAPLPTTHPVFPQQQLQASPLHLPSSTVPAPNPGARLMALLGTQSSGGDPVVAPTNPEFSPPDITSSSEPYPQLPVNVPVPPMIPPAPPISLAHSPPVATPSRLPSSKLPKGRHIGGEHVVYNIDERLPGEVQPQLEVNPITKYASDPGLVVGRQIAVNAKYICYGLKQGAIRVLNIHTALRQLFRWHTQRVTDMAFFAEDVHLLASASVDGRVFIWKITEDCDDDKPQITGKIILAIQIVGDKELFHPRVCWHTHKQEILMVGIGNYVLVIDTIKVAKGNFFSEEEPIKCSLDKLIDGIYCIGKHDGEVTDLSICQWMSSRLASASTDGMVKIWGERKSGPIAVLKPHDGQPVSSVTFSVAPERPDHIVLLTSGPLSRELKIWASTSTEGWLLHSEVEHWRCIQTLELKSSEAHVEDAFFNQVVVLSHAGLILLANAKRNAIYAVHVEYGSNPVSTHMDYIAEFTVTIPILSLTGTSVAASERVCVVQIYCVQTQAIQQYTLDLALCLPPPMECAASDMAPSNSPSVSSSDDFPLADSMERYPVKDIVAGNSSPKSLIDQSKYEDARIQRGSSAPLESPTQPPSLGLPERLSHNRSAPDNSESGAPSSEGHSVDGKLENTLVILSDVPSSSDGGGSAPLEVADNNKPVVPSTSVTFDLGSSPAHLITPAEILSMGMPLENSQASQNLKAEGAMIQDDSTNSIERVEVVVKVVGEGVMSQEVEAESKREMPILVVDKRERAFYSQASGIGCGMTSEYCPLPSEAFALNDTPQVEDSDLMDKREQPCDMCAEEGQYSTKDVPGKSTETSIQSLVSQSPTTIMKMKKHKVKASQPSLSSSASPSPFNSTDSSNGELGGTSSASAEAACAQILAMQDSLNQLITMQKEMQRQMAVMVTTPISKEGKRIEAGLGRNMEKIIKANIDAMWARFLEENAKHEKVERDRVQQLATLISNATNKDLPSMMDKTLKKEIAAIGPTVTKTIISVLEKTIPSAVTDSFQKGVGDKAAIQLEKSICLKLDTTVSKLIQVQFQTSVKQTLQDALRATMENSLIPAFEVSCKTMFEQVDVTLQKGMGEYIAAVQQQFESAHTTLALGLREGISTLSSAVQTLNNEVADGQQKILAFAVARANPVMDLITNAPLSNGPQVEARIDPTKELARLVSEHKFEEAFTAALQRSDVSLVSWLCSQVDLPGILSTVPLPLSQGVLLSLVQQLACDLGNDTSQKLSWVAEVAMVLNPSDPMITMHARPILEQIYQMLARQRAKSTAHSEVNSIRMVMHVISSISKTCR